MPKVSVIVPVYNVQKYLAKCLDSLVSQTLKDIEIIIVNDGSTDRSESIIKKYEKKYDNIVYVKKKNGGLSDARNYGIKYAKGDYIAFIDSDDFVDTSLYEKMYTKAIEEEADYIECDFYWTYPKNRGYRLQKDEGIRYADKQGMMTYGRVMAWNKLIKRNIITENFPKGLKYEDIEFFYKLIPNVKKFAFVEEPLIYYVQRNNSLANKQDYTTGQIFNVLQNVLDFYKDNNLYDEYKEALEYTYVRTLLCRSLRRITKIKDNVAREKLIYETWQNVNTKFPNWKQNNILKKDKNIKNFYLRMLNNLTYNIAVIFCKHI